MSSKSQDKIDADIAKLQNKLKAKRKIKQRLSQRQKTQERKHLTRCKILIGAELMALAESDDRQAKTARNTIKFLMTRIENQKNKEFLVNYMPETINPEK